MKGKSGYSPWYARTAWLTCVCAVGLILLAPQGRAGGQASNELPSLQEQAKPPTNPPQLTAEVRADIFMARKEYADAVDYYLRSLKNDGNQRAAVWNKLGIAYQQLTDFDSARKSYKKAIRFQKDFPEPWNNLGTTYFLQGKPKKSTKYYQEAIKLNPASAPFHLNLGSAYFRRKKFDEAMVEYRAALELDPQILVTHSKSGTVMRAETPDARYYFYLAKIFASLGRNEEAIRYLRRAFEDGFQDIQKLGEDPDFKKISTDPTYVELINHPPVAIKE